MLTRSSHSQGRTRLCPEQMQSGGGAEGQPRHGVNKLFDTLAFSTRYAVISTIQISESKVMAAIDIIK